MNGRDKPLLSICIPTFNRAELLETSLLSVVPQLIELGNSVELVVSDNCSSDNTRQVVAKAMESYPLRYHVNEKNIGGNENIAQCGYRLARGEYCWILGDDDFIRPGGVARVLKVLRDNPDVEFVFINFLHLDIEEYTTYPKPITSGGFRSDLRLGCKATDEHPVEKFDDLIDPTISAVFHGSMQTSVVRTSVWTEHGPSLRIGVPFSDLDSTYPHIKVFANGLIGKKAYYLGEPQLIVVDGAREWIGYVPIIVLVRLNEVLDLYQSKGVDPARIDCGRTYLQVMCGTHFCDLFFNRTSCGRKYFSVRSFFGRYGITAHFALGFVRRLFTSWYRGDIDRNPISALGFAFRRMIFIQGDPGELLI